MVEIINGKTPLPAEFSTDNPRYISVTADLSASPWNTDASHEVFTVTGLVRIRMIIECTENVTSSGGNATLQFGDEDTTDLIIGATDENAIDIGELWYDTSPTTFIDTFANAVMDYVDSGKDIGYEIDTEATTNGLLVFHCAWEPLNSTGLVVAGAGGTL